MSDTLYIQTKENVEVHHPHVYLQDIAKLSCTNSKILNRSGKRRPLPGQMVLNGQR